MYITSGHAQGHRLQTPKIKEVNPVIASMRKPLFDSISDKLIGARVLDLFAGTGSLGLEALSRGAIKADFVERESTGCKTINNNLRHSHFIGKAQVYCKNVTSFLADCIVKYDIVFLDPPMSFGDFVSLFDLLPKNLAPHNLVILRYQLKPHLGLKIKLLKSETYGYEKVYFLTFSV